MRSIICLTFLFAVGYASPQDSRCSEPREIGPCRGAFPRFFFDQETSTCRPFFYGGCRGNGNNFRSLNSCLKTCGRQEETSSTPVPEREEVRVKEVAAVNEACSLNKDAGPCRGAHLRFYFNSQTSDCEAFLFGGCDGNANNFRSLKQCFTACSPSTHQDQAPRSAFSTPAAPVHACNQEKKTGPCRGALPRYYFNQQAGKCELFVYGGCEGNQNNFRTEQECNDVCPAATGTASPAPVAVIDALSSESSVQSRMDDDVCDLVVESGPCYGNFPRYFHNKVTGKCEEFIYGGCHGNGNNFNTVDECDAVCGNHVESEKRRKSPEEESPAVSRDPEIVCALPADDGGCRAAFPMYYFNKQSNSCEEFLYGGCRGNDNRFHSKESCTEFCKPVMQ